MMGQRIILVVEDNEALRDNLREILEDAGYAVRAAGTCAEALAAPWKPFDVALVDVRLPDGDGLVLATRLRELAPSGQVIMLTGFASIESAVAAVRAGAWAYLVKPCSTPDLLVAVAQAVRQLEHAEENLELARRTRVAEKLAAVGTLTAGLSHEIKNPLNAAGLQLTVLQHRIKRLPADVQATLSEPVKLVQDEIRRLSRLVEEFLHFARPRPLAVGTVDLAGLLGRVADLLAPQAHATAVSLERRWDDLPTIAGDEERLQQVLINLVINAIQAAGDEGRVVIEAVEEQREVVLAIEDSGPGIPDELRHRVFEPFFTTKSGGSGLGLPLVHSIVEQHGGTVGIERAEGGGARIAIRLPIGRAARA
jgi:two-component system sensor histidine kinase HydH